MKVINIKMITINGIKEESWFITFLEKNKHFNNLAIQEFQFLNFIDLKSEIDYINKHYYYSHLSEICQEIEENYSNNYKIWQKKIIGQIFEDSIFNNISNSEFADYLNARYYKEIICEKYEEPQYYCYFK